jgi:hypothetical protein
MYNINSGEYRSGQHAELRRRASEDSLNQSRQGSKLFTDDRGEVLPTAHAPSSQTDSDALLGTRSSNNEYSGDPLTRDDIPKLPTLLSGLDNVSTAEYSFAQSSRPSDAPEFYQEEPVTLNRLEEVLAVEHGLRESCRTLPITTAIWVFFTLLIFYHGQVQGSFECAECVAHAMRSISVPAVNSTETMRKVSIGNVTERHDILQWVYHGMAPLLTVPNKKFGQLQRTQQLIGKVRIEQKRSMPKKCKMNSKLQSFHPGDCHPPKSSSKPEAYGTTKLDYEVAYRPFTAGEDPKDNKGLFVAWLDIGRNISTVNEGIQSLLDFNWLDDNSQEVIIQAMFLNTEMNVYSFLTIRFQLHRSGWIQQDLIVEPIRGDVYYHWALIFADIIWIICVFLLIWQTALHALEEYRSGLLYYWATDIFVILDMMSIAACISVAVYFWALVARIDSYTDKVKALGGPPIENGIEAAMAWKTRYVLWNWQYERKLQVVFDDFQDLQILKDYHRFVAFMYNIIIVCRFFRGFTGQPRIAVLMQTIGQVQNFLFHFLVVFAVVMGSFIVTGYLLFGEQVTNWSTVGKATASCFLMLFGKFTYNDFHNAAPYSAIVWFCSFYILAVFLLLSIMTAAILHHYLTVRSEVGEVGISIVQQLRDAWNEFTYSRTYDGAQKSIPPDKLFEMVAKESDPLRIRRLARTEIDRRLRTRDHIHEAEQDPKIDEEFLIDRGMGEAAAERLIERIKESGHGISMRSDPLHRLILFLVRQMAQLRHGASHMRKKTTTKVTWAARAVDRIDLKHAKCEALARRVRRAQEPPPGWVPLTDSHGRTYLRQEQTGLTSWTLPRHLI